MKIRRAIGALGLIVVAVSGCASGSGKVDVPAWQQRLEEYVTREGNGDLNVVRMTDPDAAVPMFNVLGGDEAAGSRDVAGLWLGQPQVEGRRWHVFLVATIDDQEIQQIHLAAVTPAAPQVKRPADRPFEWRVGKPNSRAFSAFQRSVAPFTHLSPDPLSRWKSGAEAFTLRAAGSMLTATHADSGAAWQVDLRSSQSRPTVAGRTP